MQYAISLTIIRINPGIPMVNEREKKMILLVTSPSSFLSQYTGSSITVALPAMASQS